MRERKEARITYSLKMRHEHLWSGDSSISHFSLCSKIAKLTGGETYKLLGKGENNRFCTKYQVSGASLIRNICRLHYPLRPVVVKEMAVRTKQTTVIIFQPSHVRPFLSQQTSLTDWINIFRSVQNSMSDRDQRTSATDGEKELYSLAAQYRWFERGVDSVSKIT